MASLHHRIYEIGRIDALALADTPLHRVDARAKVLATVVFVVCVVSFPRYAVAPLAPFALFPVVLAAEGGMPAGWIASRLAAAAPFALLVGALNPLVDRTPIAVAAGWTIAAGWVSYASIVARFLLTAAAALTLVGITGMNGVCAALGRLGVPGVLVTQLLFLYRYIFVLAEEALRMVRARDLRSFGRRGTGIAAFGALAGTLLLRTYARARRIHSAMLLRGFDGRVRVRRAGAFGLRDTAFLVGWSALFVVLRLVDVTALAGALVQGMAR